MGTDLGTNAGEVRWDLVPEKGTFLADSRGRHIDAFAICYDA